MDGIAKLLKNKFSGKQKVFENMSYMTILQIFYLVAPLITYPYLIRILGRDLYGIILTAQMLVSYASVIIDFGSNSVCAKFISINRESKEIMSEVVSSVLVIRIILWVLCFVLYSIIVFSFPIYSNYYLVFLLSYGITINDILFPQFFFQGIENMKYITYVSVTIKLIFILLVFVFVKTQSDFIFVPLLYSIGYAVGALISMVIMIRKFSIKLYIPSINVMKYYFKESSPILATDLISSIKDKLNYLLLGSFIGMSNVVIYDLGLKINMLVSKPVDIIKTVMFPRMAKNRNIATFKKLTIICLIITLLVVLFVNIFLKYIVLFFLHDASIDLLPIRVFLICPIILSVSTMIASNLMIAFGYNRFILNGIIITTGSYLVFLAFFYLSNNLSNIYSFIFIAIASYMVELIYRLFKTHYIIRNEK